MAKKIEIELGKLQGLAALQCTEAEAAAVIGCNVNKFREILKTMPDVKEAWDAGKEHGKTSLRRRQFRLAATSASMAIHLGKNILNQKDAQTIEHTNPDGSMTGIDVGKLSQDDREKLRSILIGAIQSEDTAGRTR